MREANAEYSCVVVVRGDATGGSWLEELSSWDYSKSVGSIL